MKYKIAIFDMDGTILNTLDDLTDALNYTLEQFHMPLKTTLDTQRYVGNGIKRIVEQAVPLDTPSNIIDEMYLMYLDFYSKHCYDKTKPYEYIRDIISKCKDYGLLTAVISNKRHNEVLKLCDKFFPYDFDYILGLKEGNRKKPFPDSIIEIKNYFNLNDEDIIYIGDSETDYLFATNANVDLIMVSYGFRSKQQLLKLNPKIIVDSPLDIIKYIK